MIWARMPAYITGTVDQIGGNPVCRNTSLSNEPGSAHLNRHGSRPCYPLLISKRELGNESVLLTRHVWEHLGRIL